MNDDLTAVDDVLRALEEGRSPYVEFLRTDGALRRQRARRAR